MESVAASPVDAELNLLTDWGDSNRQSRTRQAAIASVLVHVFGIVLLLSRDGFEADKLDDFKGLNQRSPWYAFMMLLAMFSLAGVPPSLRYGAP